MFELSPLEPTSAPSTRHEAAAAAAFKGVTLSRGKMVEGAKIGALGRSEGKGGKDLVFESSNEGFHQPMTPRSKVQQESTTLYDGRFVESSSSSKVSLLQSTPSTNAPRAGHVFWQATPSPSQQIRQNELKRYLSSSTSPILPLGTQAFREELLQQGMINTDTQSKQAVGAEQRRGLENREEASLADSDRSCSSGGGSTSSTLMTSRKFSRRVSRRSMGVFVGDCMMIDKSQSGEGMQQLLADLNQHLKSHGNEVDDAEEQSLVEELDRIFSSPRERSSSPADQNFESASPVEETNTKCESQFSASHEASPSSSREWNRTKSLPAELDLSPAHEKGDRKRSSIAKVYSAGGLPERNHSSRQGISKRTLSPPKISLESATPVISELQPERIVLKDIVARQSKEEANQEVMESSNMKQIKSKTRSSISPPKKWATARTPRIGLSRHSIGPSQGSSSLQSGPSAPFKKPTRFVDSAVERSQKVIVKEKEVIVIHDSDEEVQDRRQVASPVRRTSPRKQAALIFSTRNTTKTNSEAMITDQDTSFDTSMDESMLCDALDRAEASQKAFEDSQRIAKPPCSSIGNDSFEMESSDNEAICSVMEASGW